MPELAAVLQAHGFSQPLSQPSVSGAEQLLQLSHLPGITALESWQKLRQLVTETGYWPVILGPLENLDFLRDNWELKANVPAPAEVLKKAAQKCPENEVHIRLLETWYVRYGAELLGHSNDVLELRVACPVQVLEEARELAHFIC